MASLEGGSSKKKWDARRTRRPATLGVLTRQVYATPEDALAAWHKDRCGLPAHVNHWDKIMRIPDLVLIIRQREARAKNGRVEILTLDLRGQPR